MSRFTADYSSSINSTPVRDPPSQQRNNQFFSSNPSQYPSTTPIAPPPSQIFGSSGLGTGVSKLQFSQPSKSSRSSQPASRPFHTSFGTSQASEYTEQDDEEYSDGLMEEDEEEHNHHTGFNPPAFHSVNNPSMRSLMKFSTNSSKQSRNAPQRRSLRVSRLSALPQKGDESIVINLARDLGSRSQPAPLTEPDEAIMQTENVLRSLEDQLQYLKTSNDVQETIAAASRHLLARWQRFVGAERPSFETPDVGPPTTASLMSKANYLVSLLLILRHPPRSADGDLTPTPKILLDWLDHYHVSYDELFHSVASHESNCTASPIFWGAIQSFILRGKLQFVMQLFADADFKYAASAVDDGSETPGYKGAQLQSIQSVIYRTRVLLNSCPAIQNGDWDVAGVEWDLFRTQVEAELEALNDLAANHDDDDDGASFEAESFGIRKPGNNLLTKLGRQSTSTIPWSIFTGLKIVYNILLGSAEEIVAQSQDWLEAVTSLTIWWDGNAEAAVAQWSFDVSRANNMADDDDKNNDINPYLNRLRDSFLSVTSPDIKNSPLRMNTMSPVEVGLGNILQGNVTGALIILRTLSQCIAASVAEIGAQAGWLEHDSQVRPAGLNEDDLMVLSYGAPKHGVSKDELMLGYAEVLFNKPELAVQEEVPVEGWEVALSVVSRLDDREAMHNAVSNFIDNLDVVSQDRAEKLAELCSGLGLKEEARKVSDRFGDYLVNNTTEYGTALLCYARSHSSNKVRQLIDLLISYSLVQSRAYPPDDEIDEGLQSLVENPRTALADIAEFDGDAAEILQFYLVGYACLRRFYSLRDEGAGSQKSGKPSGLRPLARRRTAAKALVTAINSAADSIYGGLYDPERQSAIQVDGLLTLLGEATAFLSNSSNNNSPTFTAPQIYELLAAIEDLSTVSSRVYDATEECLQAALRNFHGSQPPSPHAMLKKSMSSGTNSNFSFSMMGSEMINTSASSSGVLVGKPGGKSNGTDGFARGWDWRTNFKDKGCDGKDVVRALRVGLAAELSLAELDE